MISNKFMVAVAALASLAVIDAGPCKPKTSGTTTSATGTVSAGFTSSTELPTTFQTRTATTESQTASKSEDTTTANESGTTTAVSLSESLSTITISETTTTASDSEMTTAETTTVDSSEATTILTTTQTTAIASSSETTAETVTTETTTGATTTMATTTEGTTTTAETATTATTADAGPTTLLINGDFESTIDPWLSSRENEPPALSDQHYEGASSGRLDFGIENGQAYDNYIYQKIDKRLLKAGMYHLMGFVKVDFYAASRGGDGCNSMAAGCFKGDPNNLQIAPIPVSASPDNALDWFLLDTMCTFTDEMLAQVDYISVVFAFSCANAGANVDDVTFERVD